MDPFTISLLAGSLIGGAKNLSGKKQERKDIERNAKQRQAAAMAQAYGLNYAIPEEQKERSLLQDVLTGAATGANAGQQVGLAKNLINKAWAGDPNTYNGQPFQDIPTETDPFSGEEMSFGPERPEYFDEQAARNKNLIQTEKYNQATRGFDNTYGKNVVPSAWDSFAEQNLGPLR